MKNNMGEDNSSNPKQGEVYLADVNFKEVNKSKRRPVVIVSNERAIDIDVLTAPITSSEPRGDFDIVITEWDKAGLLKPSVARTSKLLTISTIKLKRKLGDLQPGDLKAVLEKCTDLF